MRSVEAPSLQTRRERKLMKWPCYLLSADVQTPGLQISRHGGSRVWRRFWEKRGLQLWFLVLGGFTASWDNRGFVPILIFTNWERNSHCERRQRRCFTYTPRGSPIWSLVVRRKNSSGCLFIAGSFQSDTTGIASFEIGRVCLVYSTTWWSNKGLKVTLYVNFGFTR